MYVIEIFLPLTENDGHPITATLYQIERMNLIEKFGGLTVYSRSPAAGFWERDQTTVKDDIVIFEVVTQGLDVDWWAQYRSHLQHAFKQQTILIRAVEATIL